MLIVSAGLLTVNLLYFWTLLLKSIILPKENDVYFITGTWQSSLRGLSRRFANTACRGFRQRTRPIFYQVVPTSLCTTRNAWCSARSCQQDNLWLSSHEHSRSTWRNTPWSFSWTTCQSKWGTIVLHALTKSDQSFFNFIRVQIQLSLAARCVFLHNYVIFRFPEPESKWFDTPTIGSGDLIDSSQRCTVQWCSQQENVWNLAEISFFIPWL